MTAACIVGLSGKTLTAKERAFFADLDPWAFILFKRNVETPEQLCALTSALRDCVGRDALIFIDQEGGRVQRLRPPHWRDAPPAAAFARLYALDRDRAVAACRLNHGMLAAELLSVGITADCAPVLDIPQPGADPIIGDRAFGAAPDQVIALGAAAIEGLEAGGVAAVIKHVPGHGRALVDSHLKLPRIAAPLDQLQSTDFTPFRALAGRAGMAMTAHIVLESVDSQRPATTSPKVMREIVRKEIGFDGLVMTDDIGMKALRGPMRERAEESLKAGCDVVLHCSGNLPSMRRMAEGVGRLAGKALKRAKAAQSRPAGAGVDLADATRELAALMRPLERAA